MVPAIPALLGIPYNLLAVAGAMRFRRGAKISNYRPPVSILKPVRGRDPGFYEAIRSHASQRYPEFEILFGVADPEDPAMEDIQQLRREFPSVPIRVVGTANDAPNRKVGALEILSREARYDTLLVNDGDIRVHPDYLVRVLGLLGDPQVGLVTCLYRGRGGSVPSRAEALGIATEFAPSVLVARLLSSSGFALGSTMAFRRAELDAIGGFASIREFLADDYQLGARISALGKRIAMSDSVVETNLGAGNWAEVWRHQTRWSRTIRVSRPGGYFGYAVTQATFWCLVAALTGNWPVALGGMAARMCAAAASMHAVGAWDATEFAAVPARDLFGFAVWCAGIGGREVEWRGTRFRLMADGRIRPV